MGCTDKKPAAGQQPPGFIPDIKFGRLVVYFLTQGIKEKV
jgi:hypothetical protein